jgi:hypothetical protein
MGDHVAALSVLPPSGALALAVLLWSLALTLVHTGQELRGKFWKYYGAIGGVVFPDALGFVAFFIGVTFMVGGSAVVGIGGALPFTGDGGAVPLVGHVSARVAMIAIGFLIGARIADAWYSHMRLDRLGFRPNPGLPSAWWYVADGILVAVLFAPGIRAHWKATALGIVLGWLVFTSVLFNVRLLGRLAPGLKHDPWVAGTPRPEWAT